MMGATTLSSPTANKGLNGAKKTITDFFGKSPQKSPLSESKHKDLLDYFSKPSCGKNNSNGLLPEEFSHSANSPNVAPVNNLQNSINAKNKKRKHHDKEFTISNNNHDDGAKTKKRKSSKSNDLLEKNPLKMKNPSPSSLITDKLNQSSEKSEETADVQEEVGTKKVRGKSVKRSLAKPKCADGKTTFYEWSKPLVFGASTYKTLDNDLASSLSDDISDTDVGSPKALELSYEEFLLSQETESEKLEDQTEPNEDKLEELEDDVSASPCSKSTKSVSIATFFSPIRKPLPKEETPDYQKVTVLADIHPEPRQKCSSPKKKPTGSKSGELVLKTISLNAKSKAKEQDHIVFLSTENPSDLKEVPTPDGTKQKSSKKTNSSAERGTKKSAKKDSSSASNVKDEKSSQSLLNFSRHKPPSSSKVQEETSAIEDTNSSQLTMAIPNEKSKCQSDVQVKTPENDAAVQETVDTKPTLKRKRGRPRKNPLKTPENIALVKEPQPAKNPKEQNGTKELQTAEKSDRDIDGANVEIPIPKTEENDSGKMSSDEQEKADGSSVEDISNDDSEKKSQGSDCTHKIEKNTPRTDESVPTTPGTRRSARLREHKTLSPPSTPEEVHSPTVTPKTRKEKKKPNSRSSEKSKESSTGKESQTKQADLGKLASIFLKKKDKEKEKALPVIDEEALKLRRAFLMSGLTDEAKKQQQANALLSSVVVADYPPLPLENHIQQKPLPEEEKGSGLDVWNLPEVSLAGLAVSDDSLEVCSLEIPQWNCPSALLRICEDKAIQPLSIKSFSGHIPLSEMNVSATIKNLSTANLSYPVQRFYDMAKAKSRNALKSEGESTESKEKPVENQKASEPPIVERPKRRGGSLMRRKSVQAALEALYKESIDKEKIETALEDKGCDILWTEKYQPQHSVEVISNCGNLKKLKSWLLEWKQQTDKEIRKLRKLFNKQRKNKKSKGEDSSSASSWLDDDSTFEASSSESDDDDDDSLCNTMLLSGPHGVGKTSAIYALATELGYQVFEVNASSARTGKKILMQLQEATQSHQVSKDQAERTTPINIGLMNNLTNQNKVAETSNTSQKKLSVPASFANFFKSSKNVKTDSVTNSKENKPDVSKSKKKQASLIRKKGEKSGKVLTLNSATGSSKQDMTDTSSNCDFESTSDKIKKRVNISSTSLILFDEVDVVLEEDKGFWAAIQNFMQSTKRPIILTASSADIAEQFGSSCEHLSFRIPSTKVITSHLQTLCLAENVLTDSSGISSLVDYFDADMRKCLLNLQFWINSGGDLSKHRIPSGSNRNTKKKSTKSVDTLSSKNQNRLTHEHCLESCLGLNPQNVKKFFNDDLIRPLSKSICWEDLTPVCFHGYQRHYSLLHQLFTSKLPLPRKSFPPLPNRLQLLQKARKQVARNNPLRMLDSLLDSGLYDSESSSLDEPMFSTMLKSKEKEDKMDTNSQPMSCSQESEASYSASQPAGLQMESLPAEESAHPVSEIKPEDVCQQRNCENKILGSLAKFYECCSYTDALSKSCGYVAPVGSLSRYSASGRSTLTSGLWDELPMEESCAQGVHWWAESTLDIVAHLELRTYVNCQQDISQASENVVSGQEHSISVAPQQQCSGFPSLQLYDRSRSVNQERAVENVLSNIPLSSGFQHHALHLDYLPMLRDVCRAEKMRQQAKVKRRFFHYFDNICFPLRESTLNVLAGGFT